MQTDTQWVAFVAAEGAMLKAPLPSAQVIGPGWRGVAMRWWLPYEQLDMLVEDAAGKVGAAIGLAAAPEHAYVVAGAQRSETVRLILGVDVADAPPGASDALRRCGVSGKGVRWRRATAKAFAGWSEHAPRRAGEDDVAGLIQRMEPADAVLALLGLLDLEPPAEPIPDPLDLQHVARESLEPPPSEEPEKRPRRFRR